MKTQTRRAHLSIEERSFIMSERLRGSSCRKRSQGEDRRGQIVGMRSIHERPLEIEGRTVPGHWEGDLIKGAYNRSAVGTLVERTSRYVLLAKMDGTDAHVALEGFTRILRHLPRCMRQTLTYDQGREMAK